jgi:hypothetical protein
LFAQERSGARIVAYNKGEPETSLILQMEEEPIPSVRLVACHGERTALRTNG